MKKYCSFCIAKQSIRKNILLIVGGDHYAVLTFFEGSYKSKIRKDYSLDKLLDFNSIKVEGEYGCIGNWDVTKFFEKLNHGDMPHPYSKSIYIRDLIDQCKSLFSSSCQCDLYIDIEGGKRLLPVRGAELSGMKRRVRRDTEEILFHENLNNEFYQFIASIEFSQRFIPKWNRALEKAGKLNGVNHLKPIGLVDVLTQFLQECTQLNDLCKNAYMLAGVEGIDNKNCNFNQYLVLVVRCLFCKKMKDEKTTLEFKQNFRNFIKNSNKLFDYLALNFPDQVEPEDFDFDEYEGSKKINDLCSKALRVAQNMMSLKSNIKDVFDSRMATYRNVTDEVERPVIESNESLENALEVFSDENFSYSFWMVNE